MRGSDIPARARHIYIYICICRTVRPSLLFLWGCQRATLYSMHLGRRVRLCRSGAATHSHSHPPEFCGVCAWIGQSTLHPFYEGNKRKYIIVCGLVDKAIRPGSSILPAESSADCPSSPPTFSPPPRGALGPEMKRVRLIPSAGSSLSCSPLLSPARPGSSGLGLGSARLGGLDRHPIGKKRRKYRYFLFSAFLCKNSLEMKVDE